MPQKTGGTSERHVFSKRSNTDTVAELTTRVRYCYL